MRQYTYSGIFLVLLVGSGLSINSGAGVLATVLFIVGMASGVLAIREDIKNKRAIAE